MSVSSALRRLVRTTGRRYTALAVAVGVAGATTAWIVLGSTPHPRPFVPDNVSRAPRVCLVTDAPRAAASRAAWSGVEDAARRTPLNAQRLVVPAGAGSATLRPYLDSLVERRCATIVAAGDHLDATVAAVARSDPRQEFLSTGASPALPNVTRVAPTTRSVEEAVYRAARRAHTPPRRPAS